MTKATAMTQFSVGDKVMFHLPPNCKHPTHPRPNNPGPHTVVKIGKIAGNEMVYIDIPVVGPTYFAAYWFKRA